MRGGGHSLAALVRAFRGRRCLVVGDAMIDVFERGRAGRLAPDAPAPVVTNVRRTSSPGGAANVAANLAAMGARVTLLSVVGDDGPGLELLEKLSGAGVETGEVVREPYRATVEKKRLVADGEHRVEGRDADEALRAQHHAHADDHEDRGGDEQADTVGVGAAEGHAGRERGGSAGA